MAQCRQRDVFAAMGMRGSDVLEVDVAATLGQLGAALTLRGVAVSPAKLYI